MDKLKIAMKLAYISDLNNPNKEQREKAKVKLVKMGFYNTDGTLTNKYPKFNKWFEENLC